MKLYTFTYTKADGKSSKRVLAAHNAPSKFYMGTDLSELSMEDQALYASEVNAAKEVYLEKVKALNDKYDLNFKLRQFDPEKMTDLVEEEI